MTIRKHYLAASIVITACSGPIEQNSRTDGVFDMATADEGDITVEVNSVELQSHTCQEVWDDAGRQIFVMGTPENPETLPLEPESPGGFSLAGLEVPALSSKAGALKTIYLDFTGHTTSNTYWNSKTSGAPIVTPAYSSDADVTNFSAGELAQIQEIWQRVAEDYAPFDVNVTTVEPQLSSLEKAGADDTSWGVRVVIGGRSSDWFGGGAGGVAYIGSFNASNDLPVFVFPGDLGNGYARYVAEAASHEVGHSLGLPHQGTDTVGYYTGSGTGATGWAPIMGVGYYQALTTWSRGVDEDTGLALTGNKDELLTITSSNGFGYRQDDFGQTIASATPLAALNNSFSISGLIEKGSDLDIFRFTAAAGSLQVSAAPTSAFTNLDLGLALLDANGQTIVEDAADGDGILSAALSRTLDAGTYYLVVKPHRFYGRLGAYKLSGSFTSANVSDTSAPQAALTEIRDLTVAGSSAHRFGVRYTDDVAVRVTSLDQQDIQVVGPSGEVLPVRFVTVDQNSDGPSRLVSYEVASPQGQWSVSDNGTYSIRLVASQVADSSNNLAAAKVLGSFKVAISTALPRTLSGRITFQGQALAGVTMSSGFGASGMSDSAGQYSFANVTVGTMYSIVPSKAGFSFLPANIAGTVSETSQVTGLNFTASCASGFTVSLSPLGCVKAVRNKPGRGAGKDKQN